MGGKKPYSSRKYLNPKNHPSTGDVYCFCGDWPDAKEQNDRNAFISISDCHAKVRLHVYGSSERDKKDFIHKLEILSETANTFRNELKLRWGLK